MKNPKKAKKEYIKKKRKSTLNKRRASPYRINKPQIKTKRKLNKNRIIIFIAIIILISIKLVTKNKTEKTSTETSENIIEEKNQQTETEQKPKVKIEINDWRLTLANYENILPEDYTVEVANIDDTRQFDKRAIDELKQMMNDMGKAGISNIWVQSAYRSVERQKELYDNSVRKYISQGKTQEEAEKLTDEYINKPGSSDHNLGLAVDFNYVDNKFEDLKGFKWLKENAENYGFILRYPKDKEEITKISYESWHWRYVGVKHAKKMNDLNMCLEEYIRYLQGENE